MNTQWLALFFAPKMLSLVRGFQGFRGLLRGGFVLCAFALLIPAGCGSSESNPPPTDPAGGRGAEAGEDGRGGTSSGTGGSNGGTAGNAGDGQGGSGNEGGAPPDPDELAPVVEIVSPEALEEPSDGPVLTGGNVRVVCRAEQSAESGSQPVDPNGVVLTLLDANGVVVDDMPGVATGDDGEYTATFDLIEVPNGVVSFGCEAADLSEPPLTGTAQISTFVDNGPVIVLRSPLPESVYAQQGEVPFEFEVTASPLTDDDDEAEVDSVTLEVANVPIDLEENEPGVFTAMIDPDGMMFDAPLSGPVSVVIRATNRRSDPGPATRAALYDFLVDAEGPVITILNPTHESIIGGVVTLEFTVEDELAGVEPSSIVVSVNREDHPFDPVTWPSPSGDRYEFVFDSRLDWGSRAQLTITIAATDTLLNAARPATMLLYLDNTPPVLDLDPETIRELRLVGTENKCSYPFDPLGRSPNDATTALVGLPRMRAFVWDDTNSVPNVPGRYIGTDQDSVYLYLQPVGAQPVIVNTTSPGGVCNAINPALSEETRIQLTAVPPDGESFYGAEEGDPLPNDPPMSSACDYQGAPAPMRRCNEQASDLTRVMQHGVKNNEPVVYANGNLVQPDCTGAPWEIAQFFEDDQEGWFCLAAIASDLLGNVAVSRPLRLCYDNPEMPGVPPCWNDLSNPPSCTDGCALPPRFSDVFSRTVVIDQ